MPSSDTNTRPPATMNSHNSPLRIATFEPPLGGRIGMTLCPGKIGPGGQHNWVRNLERDLNAIQAWGARCLITLMELHELVDYQVQDLGSKARERFGQRGWHHLPIVDGGLPDDPLETFWSEINTVFHRHLDRGDGIVLHCLGGLGRTGLVACRLLVERGVSPDVALERVRQARPGAVETPAQERYVLELLDRDDVRAVVRSRQNGTDSDEFGP